MNNGTALLYAVLWPALTLVFIAGTRDNYALMLRLLAGTGIICAVLAWLQAWGVFDFAGPASRGTIHSYEDMFSFFSSGFVSAAWILAMFLAIRGRATGWWIVLTVSGMLSLLARTIYEYPGVIFPAALRTQTPHYFALVLYAIGLLGGIAAFLYSITRPAPEIVNRGATSVTRTESMRESLKY